MVKTVKIGNLAIGGDNPVLVQSMCNTKTTDVVATVAQAKRLADAGCEIIRVAVPDMESVRALRKIKESIRMPLVADIHFDYKLAIACVGIADKIRINPGNIGPRVVEVVEAAKGKAAIRIGVNMGSLDKNSELKYGRTAEAMVASALKYIELFEDHDFKDIVVSLKSSDVLTSINTNRLFRDKSDYPLHLGITEAGTKEEGSIKSAVGLGTLLSAGIGETIRVSLTEDPVEEIPVAYQILQTLGLRKGRTIVSCPTCGRTHGDLIQMAKEIQEKTQHIKKPLKIAVMGCEVNGPGEARDADIGIALGKGLTFVFKNGKIIRKVKTDSATKELLKEVDKLVQ